MKYIFLDIETTPFDIEHNDVKQYLMDKKISKEARSLNPLYSKIITIGLKTLNEPTQILFGKEKDMLEQFWKNIMGLNTTLVTFNGYKFDIPFIILRSVLIMLRFRFLLILINGKWKNQIILMLCYFSHKMKISLTQILRY